MAEETYLNEGEDIDALIANELNQLSVKDRGEVYEEIHGVEDVIDEPEHFVLQKLAEMEQEIQRIPHKQAYDLAYQLDREYVSNRSFRLLFLRCEKFDTRAAALRLVKFFEGKLELFGAGCLARDILLSDLSKDDLDALRSGHFQKLPFRDRAGRAISLLFSPFSRSWYKRYENVVSLFEMLS